MNTKPIVAAAFLAFGAVMAHAQVSPYAVTDLIVGFENTSAANDLELNLGSALNLPTSGTVDFGNVDSLLTADTGGTLATTSWSVAAQYGGSNGSASTTDGSITILPRALWYTQNNGATPAFSGESFASAAGPNTAIENVGIDLQSQTPLGSSGIAASAASVQIAGDPNAYTSQIPYANVSENLEATGPGSLTLWLLNSTTPGVNSKGGASQNALVATELGTFTLGSDGDLSFTAFAAIPEPSTYAAILGALTIGFVAIRRRVRSQVLA